ncbi:hypothetical protein [Desertimonas flava]|uniref:hypothetical protein n=1 Tax=Desertimonas flava TaxID=2064846 RepID=UPI000E353BD0|nr:hypothetical protein [Desertimonas flava]
MAFGRKRRRIGELTVLLERAQGLRISQAVALEAMADALTRPGHMTKAAAAEQLRALAGAWRAVSDVQVAAVRGGAIQAVATTGIVVTLLAETIGGAVSGVSEAVSSHVVEAFQQDAALLLTLDANIAGIADGILLMPDDPPDAVQDAAEMVESIGRAAAVEVGDDLESESTRAGYLFQRFRHPMGFNDPHELFELGNELLSVLGPGMVERTDQHRFPLAAALEALDRAMSRATR